jgi:hypothetical protein
MTQILVKLTKKEDMVVNLVKAKFDLRNKNDAIRQIIVDYEDQLLDEKLKSKEKNLKTSLNPEGHKLESLDEFGKNLGYA